jgi:hopanoid biosynthesis associated protein HpnK
MSPSPTETKWSAERPAKWLAKRPAKWLAKRPAKWLIVSGDDFGLSPEVNAGILTAHQEGILTNTSLMVNGLARKEAVMMAKKTPTLGVGLHLTLVRGQSTLPSREIPGLVDAVGHFSGDPVKAGMRYFFDQTLRSSLLDECRAQIETFLATGLPLSHIDGHLNIHLHPTILNLLLQLAREYPIRASRLTRESLWTSLTLDPTDTIRKVREGVIFSLLSLYARRKLKAAGLRFPDHLFGLHQNGNVNEAYLLGLIPRLKPGVTELYCHPSLSSSHPEVAALTSPRVKETLQQEGVSLISYRDFISIGEWSQRTF